MVASKKKTTKKKTTKKKTTKKKVAKSKIKVVDNDALMKELAKNYEIEVVNQASLDPTPWYVPFKNVALQSITGGCPGGAWTEITGRSQAGKSYLLYELMSSAIMDMNGHSLLGDAERAHSPIYTQRVGLSKSFLKTKERGIERLFKLARRFAEDVRDVDSESPIIIGVDSYNALGFKDSIKSIKEMKKDELKGYMAMKKNAIMSQLMQDFTDFIERYKIAFVLLNQGKDKHGIAFGDTRTSNAENVIGFYNTLRLWGETGAKIKHPKNDKKVIGRTSHWETLKNRKVAPFKKCTVEVYYKEGIHPHSGLYDLLKKYDIGDVKKVKGRPDKISYRGKVRSIENLLAKRQEEIFNKVRDV